MIAIMSELTDTLAPLFGGHVELQSGATLFRCGDPVRFLHLVESGCVHLVRYGEDGSAAVMQRASAGNVLAESSVFAKRYHCDALVVSDCRLRTVEIATIRSAFARDTRLLEALAQHLAYEVMRTRSRVEILARWTVEERLDGWFALNGGGLPPKGAWRAVAEDIGVSPEAFYRELQRRRNQASLSRSER